MSTYQKKPNTCANRLCNAINFLKWLIEKQAHMKFNIKAIRQNSCTKASSFSEGNIFTVVAFSRVQTLLNTSQTSN